MINEKSLKSVKQSTFSKHFCHPLYSSYCFSQIPATIEGLLFAEPIGLPSDVYSGGTFDHVILLFLDAFGWTFFEKYKSKIPVLQKIEKEGIASKITSMFPSTTAAHVTCVNTGLPPNQSGIYEWFFYEPKLDNIIAPLPFCYAGEQKPDSLPLDPKELFPQKTIYHRLAERGVKSYAFQPASISNSIYSQTILSGAEVLGYHSPKDAFKMLLQNLKGKTYSYFYYDHIDAAGHRNGPYSKEFFAKIEEVFTEIEILLSMPLPSKTAVIVTADHGMVDVSPQKTYYLNKKVPNIEKHLIFGRRNIPLAAGSCRDLFLHVRKENLNELKEILEHFLEDKAEIYLTQELIDNGFFGPDASSHNFLSRVGNLVILPYKGEAVWWYEKNRFIQNFYGAHGGLTREEMEIPFLFYQ